MSAPSYLALVCFAWVLRVLLQDLLEVLAKRLTEWFVPRDRPATYRLARGICRVCAAVAPTGSAAWAGVEGALADIEGIHRDPPRDCRVLPIAFSLLVPAFRARARWVLELAVGLAACLGWVGLASIPVVNFGAGAFGVKWAVTGRLDGSAWVYTNRSRIAAGVGCLAMPLIAISGGFLCFDGAPLVGLAFVVDGAFGMGGIAMGVAELRTWPDLRPRRPLGYMR